MFTLTVTAAAAGAAPALAVGPDVPVAVVTGSTGVPPPLHTKKAATPTIRHAAAAAHGHHRVPMIIAPAPARISSRSRDSIVASSAASSDVPASSHWLRERKYCRSDEGVAPPMRTGRIGFRAVNASSISRMTWGDWLEASVSSSSTAPLRFTASVIAAG